MLDYKAVIAKAQSEIRRVLPEREFLHFKSGVGMQVFRLSTRAQAIGVAAVTALLGYTGIATTSLLSTTEVRATAAQEVGAMRAEVAALRAGVEAATARVERRQQFLAAVVSGTGDAARLAALMPAVAAPIDTAGVNTILRPLADLERSQYAFVGDATTAAEARFEKTSGVLRRLGLRPARFLKQSAMGMGGPDEGDAGFNAEPQFKALFQSWKKLDMLEKGMTAIPSMKPVKNYTYTSGYGYRYDPFSGSTAMHKGVDLAGAHGETIFAAADGVVVEAGYHGGGYGKFVEIDHGAGIVTRYGHMSSIDVRKGDRIARGEEIGGMGSTGRSTGTHLHYEVMIDGNQVNPMPFLEASDYVLAAQDRAGRTAVGGPAEPALK